MVDSFPMMTRQIIACLWLLLTVATASAQSDKPLTNKQYWGVNNYPLTYTAAGGLAACQLFVSKYYPTWRLDPAMPTAPGPAGGPYTSHTCRTQVPNTTGGWNPNYGWTAAIHSCPISNAYWDPMLNKCVATEPPPPPPPCPEGPAGTTTVILDWAYSPKVGSAIVGGTPTSGVGKTYCVSSCQVKPTEVESCTHDQTASANGYYAISCTYSVDRTGGACSGSESKDETEPSSQNSNETGNCPAGSAAAGQDSMGTTICVGTAKPPEPPTTTTEKPPVTTTDPNTGATTTVKETTRTNADGSSTTTTTTTTTGADGTISTRSESVTTNKPDGSTGSQDKPEDKSDLCKQNPHLTICKNSQVIGSCGEVTCTGDAIQCATLRAAAAMECKNRIETEELAASGIYALGKAAGEGNDPAADGLPSPNKAASVALPSSLDGSGWLGAGAPFPDKTFTLQGHTFTIPFSEALGYLVVLRYALMIVALLVSFRILSGAIIRE